MSTCDRLVETIRPLLAGHPPELVGAVLGELLATLIANGHAPALRDEILEAHIAYVQALVPVILEAMIEAGTAPEEWRA